MVNIRRLGAYRIFPRSFSHTRLGLRPRPVLKTTSGIYPNVLLNTHNSNFAIARAHSVAALARKNACIQLV